MIGIYQIREIDHDQKHLFLDRALAKEYQHVFICGDIVDPVESLRLVIQCVQCRILSVELQQRCAV